MSMKTKNLIKVGAVVISSVTVLVALAFALSQSESKAKSTFSVASLKDVPALELPAATAHLISQAPQEKRAEVTAEAIRMAANLARPGVLPYVASSVCKSAPDVAPVALAEAIKAKPEEILPLTKAAIAAAPEQVKELVKVAVQSRPDMFSLIGRLAAIEAPTKAEAILAGIKESLPQYREVFEKAVVHTDNNIVNTLNYAQNAIEQQVREEQKSAQKQEIVRNLENNNNLLNQPDVRIANLDAKAKQTIKSAEKNITSTSSTENSAVRYSMGAPRIEPVPYTPPLYNIKPSDTVIVQPGSARNYSTP